jgi:succinate dehydrogenase / fumarate reductase cytochrome b subunit
MDKTVNHQRPINLDLGSFRYPPMAICSILHRISGIVIFLLLPVMMFFLKKSLQSELSFVQLQDLLHHPFYQLLLWVFVSAFIYHILAGIRHIVMDCGFGEQLTTARFSSVFVMTSSLVLIVLLGVWIW